MAAVKRLLVLTSLMILFGIAYPPAEAEAATAPGITLSPFLQQLSIAPDDAGRSFKLNVTNNTATSQDLQLTAQDFGSLNDTGGVLLQGSKEYNQKYGLATWLSLEADQLRLEPKETRSLLVTVTNQPSLRPGGHYGAIVASVNSPGPTSGNQIAIQQQVLSLILLTKVGGEHYDLSLESIEQNGNWLHLPTEIRLHFKNPGNIHVVPRGLVKLKSPSGTVLAEGMINTESAYVLPESQRELFVPLKSVAKSLLVPGVYHVTVAYRYDGLDRVAHKQFPVRFINLWVYVGLVVIGMLSWYMYRRRKKSVQKVLPAK